ncbi:MAG: FG-GAP repeat protein [Lysobacteraceae bacterium]
MSPTDWQTIQAQLPASTSAKAANLEQSAYLKASNTDADDEFGYSVAISGDTVVIGAQNEASVSVGVDANQADNSADGAGAVYVFVRTGGVWTQQAT